MQKAGWLNQKNAIDHVQELKSELDDARGEEERATRDGDLARASELRYAKIPQLEQEIKAAEDELAAQRERDGAGLNEQVTSDEIAEVVSAWTGVPVSKMMQERAREAPRSGGRAAQARHRPRRGGLRRRRRRCAASRAGLADPDKPIGSFFFLGPDWRGQDRARQGARDVPL